MYFVIGQDLIDYNVKNNIVLCTVNIFSEFDVISRGYCPVQDQLLINFNPFCSHVLEINSPNTPKKCIDSIPNIRANNFLLIRNYWQSKVFAAYRVPYIEEANFKMSSLQFVASGDTFCPPSPVDSHRQRKWKKNVHTQHNPLATNSYDIISPADRAI